MVDEDQISATIIQGDFSKSLWDGLAWLHLESRRL